MAERQGPETDPETLVAPDLVKTALADPSLPEVVRRFLSQGASLEAIVLSEEGRWFHNGQEFRHEGLRSLFHKSLGRTKGGTWVLRIPPYTYPVTVIDTGFHVRSLRQEGLQMVLRLSDDTEEVLDPSTLQTSHGRLYSQVKKDRADGPFLARFCREAFLALSTHLEEDASQRWWLVIPAGPGQSPQKHPIAAK